MYKSVILVPDCPKGQSFESPASTPCPQTCDNPFGKDIGCDNANNPECRCREGTFLDAEGTCTICACIDEGTIYQVSVLHIKTMAKTKYYLNSGFL